MVQVFNILSLYLACRLAHLVKGWRKHPGSCAKRSSCQGLLFTRKFKQYLFGNWALVHTQKSLSFSFICKLADLDNWTKPKSCLYSAACIFAAKLAVLSHYPCIICRSIECEFLNQAVTVLYLVQTSQYDFSNSHSNYTHLKNSTVLIHFNTCWHLLHGYQAF